MASTVDSEAAETLKLALKDRVLNEILPQGGGEIKGRGETSGSSGVLIAIDEAITILKLLREIELAKAEVPDQFKCRLSKKIMIEPVIIATGQTFEKSCITEWLVRHQTCPRTTDEVLSRVLCKPNHLVDELITRWCRENKHDRVKPSDEVAELSTDGIDSLLERLSSAEDQTEAANELRRQTKRFPNVRAFFVAEIADSVTRLLSPLSALGEAVASNMTLQENIIEALFNISVLRENCAAIAENPLVIPLLTKSLRHGTVETRRNSAATLVSLAAIDSNRILIGTSQVLRALTCLISEDDYVAFLDAATVIIYLCSASENKKNANPEGVVSENVEKVVSAGLIPVLIDKIMAGRKLVRFLFVLVVLSRDERAVEVMQEDTGFINHLFTILRGPSRLQTCENALVIVLNMCRRATPHSNRVRTEVDQEEKLYGTFTTLAKQGSDGLVKTAKDILQCLRRFGTGEEDPQME